MNNDYVQHMFENQYSRDRHRGKAVRVIPWVVGGIGVLSLAAYGLRDYWYPYVSPYLPF